VETTFNLLNQAWLPVRRLDGRRDSIRPADITSDIGTNPIVAIEWPRADFRVACIEFLIGLIATACPPADDEDAWIEGWESPPTPAALTAALASIVPAFDLDGPGPRFLQDLDDLAGEPDTPETLLIEAPGENTRRKNTALLVKPDRIARLSRPAAAMALFTLQCYARVGADIVPPSAAVGRLQRWRYRGSIRVLSGI
jgi:CRISPR system Cascade subunit CasA